MKETSPKGFGALEHHTSTVVVLPETMSDEALASSMTDVVSHEFFHIVTPLSVHSEDVHYFDYNDPTFSKHLWMYEGVTEYFATHFQVYEGLVTGDEFLAKITEKIAGSLAMDDSMSFTVMSENILEEPYASNYINVYQKGALIGMCIDIIMREQSNGERGILSLMKELSLKYGVHKPFVDDALIAEITAMTYPEVGAFLQKHVVGTTPINYQEFFDKVGIAKEESKKETNYIMNGRTLIFDANPEKNELFFNAEVANNSFWAGQGVQEKDVLVSVEGQELTLANAQQVAGGMFAWTPGKEIKVVVKRDGVTREISTTLSQSYTTGSLLKINTNATTALNALRKAWIKQ
jgi:predicted metalloprotease with PDZ domain